MNIIKGFFMAWGNFCSIPCPHRVWDDSCRKFMLVMLPVVGIFMGGLWYGITRLLLWVSFPQMLLAAVITVYPFFISGFMHLDGFMDCCDAIFSRAPLKKRKQILKDSRVGAFAVIWSIVLFLMFLSAAYSWIENGATHMEFLVLVPVLSRIAASICILKCKRLEVSQYENMAAGDNKHIVAISLFAAVSIAWGITIIGWSVLVLSGICLMAGGVAAACAIRNLGGINGDIAGYSIVWAECFALICAAIIF